MEIKKMKAIEDEVIELLKTIEGGLPDGLLGHGVALSVINEFIFIIKEYGGEIAVRKAEKIMTEAFNIQKQREEKN